MRTTVPENRENKQEAFWVAPLPVSHRNPSTRARYPPKEVERNRSGRFRIEMTQVSTIEPWSGTDTSTRTHPIRGILTVAGAERGVGGEDYENLTSRAVMVGS